MKKLKPILLILISAVVFMSCDKILGGLSNLNGTWDIKTITQKTYTSNILDSSNVQNDMGTFTFDSDGSGNYSVKNGEQTQSGSFKWFEKNDKVFINLTNLSDSVMTKNLAIGFDVVSSSSTQQLWSLEYSYYESKQNPASGLTVDYLKRMYMEMDLRKQ
jgi:hypothetical protein